MERHHEKRNLDEAQLNKSDVKTLLLKIKTNSKDTIILKLKDHLSSDFHAIVLDKIIEALKKNRVCQALYAQNISMAMGDDQLRSLTEVLKKKKIWCLNLGENYQVSLRSWQEFCNALPETNVTHMYVSEHVIPPTLKNQMRENIRNNRAKHDRHKSIQNIAVISKCTNMWWNPINAIRHQLDAKFAPPPPPLSEPQKTKTRTKLRDIDWKPGSTGYWAEGLGKGGEVPWKFLCKCGEKCSSFENFRYHPVGRMYECTLCHNWSHVDCVLGPAFQTEDLEELQDVFCFSCQGKVRRQRVAELRSHNISFIDGGVEENEPYHVYDDVDVDNENEDKDEDEKNGNDFDNDNDKEKEQENCNKRLKS